MKADLGGLRARRHVMRAAEGGKEVIQRHFVGQIDHRESQADLVTFSPCLPSARAPESSCWRLRRDATNLRNFWMAGYIDASRNFGFSLPESGREAVEAFEDMIKTHIKLAKEWLAA